MKLNPIALTIIALFQIPTVHASSVFSLLRPSHLLTKKLRENSANPSNPVTAQDLCMNFTGNWKGSCVMNGKSQNVDPFSIHQDGCDAIELGHDSFLINGTKSESDSSKLIDANAITQMTWNHDRTQLQMHIYAAVRYKDDNERATVDGTISSVNNQLSIQLKAEGNDVVCLFDSAQ